MEVEIKTSERPRTHFVPGPFSFVLNILPGHEYTCNTKRHVGESVLPVILMVGYEAFSSPSVFDLGSQVSTDSKRVNSARVRGSRRGCASEGYRRDAIFRAAGRRVHPYVYKRPVYAHDKRATGRGLR